MVMKYAEKKDNVEKKNIEKKTQNTVKIVSVDIGFRQCIGSVVSAQSLT